MGDRDKGKGGGNVSLLSKGERNRLGKILRCHRLGNVRWNGKREGSSFSQGGDCKTRRGGAYSLSVQTALCPVCLELGEDCIESIG